MDQPHLVRLKPGVEWHAVDDEVVALDLSSSSYLAVNGSGAPLWPLLAAGTTEAELVEALLRRFPIEEARARTDVVAFVGRLRQLSLLVEDT